MKSKYSFRNAFSLPNSNHFAFRPQFAIKPIGLRKLPKTKFRISILTSFCKANQMENSIGEFIEKQ